MKIAAFQFKVSGIMKKI